MIRTVTVYCSSSSDIHPDYLATARQIGAALAGQNYTVVYGGNRVGCMHAVAEGVRSARGRLVGITPQLFVDRGYHDTQADELIVTATMAERKTLLARRADAFLALPGGLGTYEELFEQLVARQLRYHDKPIVVLNQRGYFDPLRAMIEHGIEEKFIKPAARGLSRFAATADEALRMLREEHHLSADVASLSHEAAGGH